MTDKERMGFADCPRCGTELSEHACKYHRLGPGLLTALEKAWGKADFSDVDAGTIDEIATVLNEASKVN